MHATVITTLALELQMRLPVDQPREYSCKNMNRLDMPPLGKLIAEQWLDNQGLPKPGKRSRLCYYLIQLWGNGRRVKVTSLLRSIARFDLEKAKNMLLCIKDLVRGNSTTHASREREREERVHSFEDNCTTELKFQ